MDRRLRSSLQLAKAQLGGCASSSMASQCSEPYNAGYSHVRKSLRLVLVACYVCVIRTRTASGRVVATRCASGVGFCMFSRDSCCRELHAERGFIDLVEVF